MGSMGMGVGMGMGGGMGGGMGDGIGAGAICSDWRVAGGDLTPRRSQNPT
jgi:hypothetical protein